MACIFAACHLHSCRLAETQPGSLIKPDAAMPHRESLLEVRIVTAAIANEPAIKFPCETKDQRGRASIYETSGVE